MERVVLTSTHLCNLKCRLCIQGVPFYKTPYHPSLDELKEEIKSYFELVDSVDIFEISGGEPLLRNDLDLVLEYIFLYNNRIKKEIRITTNANIVPNDNLLSCAKKFGNKMFFLIDDYSVSKKAKEIAELLSVNNIGHRIRDYNDNLHFNGWVKFTDFTRIHTNEESKEIFKKCAFPSKLGFSFEIVGGEMHPCIISKRLMERGIIPLNENEFINLLDKSESIESKIIKLENIYKLNPLTSCAYCSGLCEDSVRFSPAEQLTAEELRDMQQ